MPHYGWMAVLFAVSSLLIYIGGLMCSHIAAFRVATNIRIEAVEHIAKLPLGFTDRFGSGKLRKIINDSTAATETYLAHQLPDKYAAIATPIGLIALLFVFDWRLGILSLVPVVLGFVIMSAMTDKRMAEKMKQYGNALAAMSNEAVEYVRGIPVVKTFGQTIFSFKKFKKTIDEYQKWVIAYTKELRLPMILYTAAINAVFAFLIAGDADPYKKRRDRHIFAEFIVLYYHHTRNYHNSYKNHVYERESVGSCRRYAENRFCPERRTDAGGC